MTDFQSNYAIVIMINAASKIADTLYVCLFAILPRLPIANWPMLMYPNHLRLFFYSLNVVCVCVGFSDSIKLQMIYGTQYMRERELLASRRHIIDDILKAREIHSSCLSTIILNR